MVAASSSLTVMVTGVNGFIASWIVKQLLENGHKVHACVRDASKMMDTVNHLLNFPGANNETLSLFSTEEKRLVQTWVEEKKNSGALDANFKYVAICPTMVLGPNLNPASDIKSRTMGRLLSWFQGSRTEAPNDSMSFIHVEDCARMHTNALELTTAEGRYMCLVESLHWNDILSQMKGLYLAMPEVKMYEGSDKVVPTKFNLKKMDSLGVKVRSV